MPTSSQQRLQDLESRFMELEGKLKDTPEKEAISVLHAMVQENLRYLDRLGVPYFYRDMEYDLAAARQVKWWTGGSLSHPIVQIGGQVLVEPSLDELDWTLNEAGII